MEPYLQDLGCTELACYLLLKMAFNYQMSADICEYITEEVKELFMKPIERNFAIPVPAKKWFREHITDLKRNTWKFARELDKRKKNVQEGLDIVNACKIDTLKEDAQF